LPYHEIDGFKLNYKILGGNNSKPPIILHHGFSQRLEDWELSGWTEILSDHTLLIFDALGHGLSDKPHEPCHYTVESRTNHVLELTKIIGMTNFIYFGFSMGGRIGFELSVTEPSVLDRLVIGGMHAFSPRIDTKNLERRIRILKSNRWKLIERAVGVNRENSHNDPIALAASTEAIMKWNGVQSKLGSVGVKTLLYCGEKDSLFSLAQQTADAMSFCEFIQLKKTSHSDSFYRSKEARSLVQKFIDNI